MWLFSLYFENVTVSSRYCIYRHALVYLQTCIRSDKIPQANIWVMQTGPEQSPHKKSPTICLRPGKQRDFPSHTICKYSDVIAGACFYFSLFLRLTIIPAHAADETTIIAAQSMILFSSLVFGTSSEPVAGIVSVTVYPHT